MYIPEDLFRRLRESRSKPLDLLFSLLEIADGKGVINASRSKLVRLTNLSAQTVRTSLKVRTDLKIASLVTNQELTKITICDIDSYKWCPLVTNQRKEKESKKKENPPIPPIRKEKEKEKENKNINTHARKIFQKPTVEEVQEYCKDKGYHLAQGAQYFIDYYETNGWVQGKSRKPIKDWKACVRTWVRMSKTPQYSYPQDELGCIIHDDDNRTYESNGWEDLNK